MDSLTYEKIRSYCFRMLKRDLHDRHLEDVVQYVAMKVFENENQSWEYAFLGYCRENGISQKYGKMGAQTLERAVFVGIDDDKDEENNRSFLLDIGEVEKSKEVQVDSVSDIFAEGLNITQERAEWLIKNCKFSLRTK